MCDMSACCTVGPLARAMDGHIMFFGIISCHFRDCKMLMILSLTHISKYWTFLYLYVHCVCVCVCVCVWSVAMVSHWQLWRHTWHGYLSSIYRHIVVKMIRPHMIICQQLITELHHSSVMQWLLVHWMLLFLSSQHNEQYVLSRYSDVSK